VLKVLAKTTAIFAIFVSVILVMFVFFCNSDGNRAVLAGSLVVSVVGNLMYGFSYLWGPYFLVASRVLTGIGAGMSLFFSVLK
jgi:hypothetical protein